MIRLQQALQQVIAFSKNIECNSFLSSLTDLLKATGQGLLVFYNFFKNVIVAVIFAVLLGVLLLNYFSTNFLRALAG